jgi:hypothetical protein
MAMDVEPATEAEWPLGLSFKLSRLRHARSLATSGDGGRQDALSRYALQAKM